MIIPMQTKMTLRHCLPLALFAFSLLLSVGQAQAQAADVTIPVNSSAVHFSPGNWAGDARRGGAKFRVTWNNGAYCAWYWSTTAASPTATLQISNPTPGAAISYYLDGALFDNVSVPADGGIAIQGLSGPGSHTLIVYTRNSQQTARWDRTNADTVTGLTLDADSTPGTAPPSRPWVEIVGDSITEGILADNGHDSNLADYSFLVGQGLMQAGYDYGVSACGYSGWLRPGDAHGDVPAYYDVTNAVNGRGGTYDDAHSRWNKIDAQTSLLDSHGHLSGEGGTGQEPRAILINYIVNEALSGADISNAQASVTQCLAALRHAAPEATLLVLVPPGLANTKIYPRGAAYITALKTGFTTYQTAHPKDKKVILIDLGPDIANALASPAYGGGVHPNAAGHAFLAPQILSVVLSYLRAGGTPHA